MEKYTLKDSYHLGKNIHVEENPILKQARIEREIKEAEEVASKLREVHEQKQKEILEKLEGLELIPNRDKVMLMPYASNPYKQILTESGLYVENTGEFLNPDTGEMDRMQEGVACYKVIEVGPETKYAKIGDDVFCIANATTPVPFMSRGYRLTAEGNILVFINSDLKKRFNMI